ncbi:PI-PLC X domain-containing protein 2 isoform X1 [Phocoena sinus]|uniref:Phosphatidylinositol specific phospholipase C X domain containing 2 n=2 Tax=Phocoena sinus TaxID=42100 RepID=A0A8C9B2P8_PHOSS|nr:PI-PLC X domain-containing protein 2 isoform X1 [Phocoena sinus]
MLAVRKVRRKLRMGTICSPSPSGTKTLEVCNADWMASLPPLLHNVPLSNLAIPGSHDSFSYWVDEKSPVGPDQTPAIKRLARISLVKKLMKKWSVTQNLTFREQLDAGIRYFDLRVSSKPGDADQEIYFIHGLFGIRVWDGLMEIDSFLTQHPQEIVFLDFNHFYAMDEAHHKRLILRIQEAFGNKLCSACSVESMTLQTLWEKKCQVLIFYHCPFYKQYPFLWPGKKIPAPWANTTSVRKLILFLETTLSERSPHGSFHVSQAILTPRVKTIARGLVGGLKNTLVHRNLPAILDWVKTQKPGALGVNIITSDFVDLVKYLQCFLPQEHSQRSFLNFSHPGQMLPRSSSPPQDHTSQDHE